MGQFGKFIGVLLLFMIGNPVARIVFRPAITLFRDIASFVSYCGQMSI